ncbi:alpha/beta fold hydrolase [Flammeovirga kamogawensis]|uniref:Alpha/beta hydrolase n=1 Tax=Flammeovirga kamogawensis TaxID=373891 RepID=A0ABX8H6A0_9BACT|nr:alpha/beta hydrolase [Flammeovirga kamogawensis]MBB6461799.1 pimeloyl-ACP methyl ester carboxylesterase [Flammeovirga kamogawensis]QWG10715.1 alpha/beta hydrolase [Flammeovirga kamogawensis]TRX63817.1 alpha/beta hydrolase [Flammeovirga kamogawensis]
MTAVKENNSTLRKRSVLDRFYASFLMTFTREYNQLEQIRRKNNYNKNTPSIAEPTIIDTNYVEIKGEKIRYAHYHNPGKETLIMLSPLPQSIIAYSPIWKQVTAQFNVYAYDLPGFGRSTGGMEFMNFKAQGEFLKEFIETFEIEAPHIMAPDIGMPTAIYYTGMFKNDVKSLIVGDGPAIDPSTNGSIIEKLGFSNFWQFLIGNFVGAGAFVEVGNRIGYVNYVPNAYELSDYIKSYDGRLKLSIEWFRKYPESLATVNPLLEKIEVPTLLFWGDNDQILPYDNGERISKRMKNSTLHIIENCGHFSYQDQHEAFSELLSNWVNGEYQKNDKRKEELVA